MTTLVSGVSRKHVHIYLGGLRGVDEVHIHLTEDAEVEELSETAGVATPHAPSVAPDSGEYTPDPLVMLERLCAYANAENLRTLYAGLVDLGYKPHTPKIRKVGKRQESYLRWTDPVTGGAAVLYVDTVSAGFYRASDRDALSDLPGASALSDNGFRFDIDTEEGVSQTLAAAATVKA